MEIKWVLTRKAPDQGREFPASSISGGISGVRGPVGWLGMTSQCTTMNVHMGVSKNGGTPKWMVFNGKPY